MECSLGKADWMCERCCNGCEHAVSIKPADNVQVYADGKPAKVIPVRLRIARTRAIIEGEER